MYGEENAGVDMIHTTCGHSLEPKIACGHCGEMVKGRDIQMTHADNCPTVRDVMPKSSDVEAA